MLGYIRKFLHTSPSLKPCTIQHMFYYFVHRVVAGAPKANFTDGKSPEIKTPGNVFKCPINLTRNDQDDCEPMNLRQSSKFLVFYHDEEVN